MSQKIINLIKATSLPSSCTMSINMGVHGSLSHIITRVLNQVFLRFLIMPCRQVSHPSIYLCVYSLLCLHQLFLECMYTQNRQTILPQTWQITQDCQSNGLRSSSWHRDYSISILVSTPRLETIL